MRGPLPGLAGFRVWTVARARLGFVLPRAMRPRRLPRGTVFAFRWAFNFSFFGGCFTEGFGFGFGLGLGFGFGFGLGVAPFRAYPLMAGVRRGRAFGFPPTERPLASLFALLRKSVASVSLQKGPRSLWKWMISRIHIHIIWAQAT